MKTGAASTPTSSRKRRALPKLSDSSIEQTSSLKKRLEDLSSGCSSKSTKSGSEHVNTTKSHKRHVRRNKQIRGPIIKWSGNDTYGQSARETDSEKNYVTVDNAKEIEPTVSENCDSNCGTDYPWEKIREVIRDVPAPIDDVESIFDKPLPRSPSILSKFVNPNSEENNDSIADGPQLIDLDDSVACNDHDEDILVVGNHSKKYPPPIELGYRSHLVGRPIPQHLQNWQQTISEISNRAQESNKTSKRSKRRKSEGKSQPRNTVTVRGSLGKNTKPVYFTSSSSSSEEYDDDKAYIYQWDEARRKYVRHPLSPAKAIGWKKGTEEIEKDKLWDEFYREYKESLLLVSDEAAKATEIHSATKDTAQVSRSRRKSKMSIDILESPNFQMPRESFVENRQVTDSDSSPADSSDSSRMQSRTAGRLVLENQKATSKLSAKNGRLKLSKKSFKSVRRSGEDSDDIFEVKPSKRRRKNRKRLVSQSAGSSEVSPSIYMRAADDSSEEKLVARSFKKKRKPVKISSSIDEPEEIEFVNLVPEEDEDSARSVGQLRRKSLSETAIEIPREHRVAKARNSFSRAEDKPSCSSDESTSGHSALTVIADHRLSLSPQSVDKILITVLEDTEENESLTNRKNSSDSKSTQFSDNSEVRIDSKTNLRKPRSRSTQKLLKGIVTKCGSDRWLINLPKNFENQ
ncbi:uncharacterized protein [Venturia canescens]|uniref:uncharacterized protein n=1 Tax=Venturia canescens TaxID=32260 RepID=UPI001C9CE554|nr:uncharacterized protein LOC122407058 [Venturia canescens]